MVEYIATANANLAWIAWRQKNLPKVMEHGQMALELWPTSYPFQWTALWPLIATTSAQDQLSAATDFTRILLAPMQQGLPDALSTELKEALLKWDEGQSEESRSHFDRAVKTARKLGFL